MGAGQEARLAAAARRALTASRRWLARLARMRSSGVVPPQIPSRCPETLAVFTSAARGKATSQRM
jgi:hypothetical protein